MSVNRNELFGAVQQALAAGQTARAAELAQMGVASGIVHPQLLTLAAFGLWGQGRAEEAIPLLDQAKAMSPRDPNVLHLAGLCQYQLGDVEGAEKAYRGAIGAEPDFAPPYYNLGSLKQDQGEVETARTLYEKAVSLDPNYAQAIASLADLDAKAGRYDEARKRGEAALAIDPSQFAATSALAASDIAEGKVEAAETRLKAAVDTGALTPQNQAIAENLLGDVLDMQDKIPEAFEAYSVSKLRLHAIYTPAFGLSDTESVLAQAQRVLQEFEAIPPTVWAVEPPGDQPGPKIKGHVFLLGFPRSGTTLLEQVLANHPEITTLEETDSLIDAYREAIFTPGGLAPFAHADGPTLERLRAAYWQRVGKVAPRLDGRVVVDKLPINTVMLPVIRRLFPDAKILFSRRDPRDVVLSCFRRRIGMNPFMYQLLTLDGAAKYYDAVMALAAAYIAVLPLKLHIVRYEDMVEDFDREVGSVCRFIGVEWDEAMRDFARTAREGSVNTPSSAQVARGLYREGVGQWRRYAAEIAPILPIVEPWVERLGYASE